METILAWLKSLPTYLSHLVDILFIAVIFLTAFTLILGVWLGFFITRKRSEEILIADIDARPSVQNRRGKHTFMPH